MEIAYIKNVDENDPDSMGRIVKTTKEGVYVTNVNMPFLGTYINKFFRWEEVSVDPNDC